MTLNMKMRESITICILIFMVSVNAGGNHGGKGKSHHLSHAGRHHPHSYRANNPQNTKRSVCDEALLKFTLIYDGSVGLSAAINESSNIGLILDPSNNLGLLVNGQSGVAILLDYNSNTTYKLDDIWKASKKSFVDFFKGLTSLRPFLETAKQKGGGAKITDPSQDIKDEINRDLTNLGTGSLNPKEIIDLVGNSLLKELRGSLQVLYKGKGAFEVHRDVATFMKLNIALAKWLANADDLNLIGPLDPGYIFSATSGKGTILNFLEQVGEHADVSKVFSTLLKNQSKSLRLMIDIEKAVSHGGIDGMDTAYIEILMLLTGKGSIKDTVTSLLDYVSSQTVNPTIFHWYVSKALAIIDAQIKKYNNKAGLGWLHHYLSLMANDQLKVFNVNMTDVANVLYFKSLGQSLSSAVKVVDGLLSPRNIRPFIQWILNQPSIQTVLSRFLPGLNGNFSAENVISTISKLPFVNWFVPQFLKFWSNVTHTVNESLRNDYKVIMDELSSGSFGDAISKLIRLLMSDVSNFFTVIREYFGNPLQFFGNLVSTGEGIGETIVSNGVSLLESFIPGLNSSDRASIRRKIPK